MLDLKTTVDNLDRVKAAMANRKAKFDAEPIERLAARRKELLTSYNGLRFEQRQAGDTMKTIDKKGPEFAALREKLKTMSQQLKDWDTERAAVEAELQERMLFIPNIPHESVPVGADESANVEVER